ncbi:MAG TPA: hypothetical protein VF829_02735 [Candidatus Paceibacterota bacterium]
MSTPASSAAQKFVPVKEIRNGVIVLKDGGYRGVLICSSVNFGLKSADEQNAIISGFQTFLNTLDFPVEIVVQSRKMDIRPYLALLAEKEKTQQTELLRLQLREYMSFIRSFTENTNIMTKSFYVVVPYSPTGTTAAKDAAGKMFGGSSSGPAHASDSFEEHLVQLQQRLGLVASGLGASGVRAVPLGTEEVIELLYRSFNPGELENPIRLEN